MIAQTPPATHVASNPDADVVSFAVERGLQMRFIEHVPLDGGHTWRREEMVTAEEILAAVTARFGLEPLGHDGAAAAETFRIAGTDATVGVIASVTRKLPGHGIDDPSFVQPSRPMSSIGG